jgi:hypothetical protein
MAKKKHQPEPEPDDDDDADDPLGKLIERHHVSLCGVLVIGGFLLLVGLGVTGYALTREPISLLFLAIGGFVLLMAGAFLVFSLVNVGRKLEVRKHGLRYTAAGTETELRWDEIAAVEVQRTDDTALGVVNVVKTSADTDSASGPLTQTDWDVIIHAHDGRSIRLPPMFFKIVPNPKKLINQIKMRAGL